MFWFQVEIRGLIYQNFDLSLAIIRGYLQQLSFIQLCVRVDLLYYKQLSKNFKNSF